jgi:hypothetical protein
LYTGEADEPRGHERHRGLDEQVAVEEPPPVERDHREDGPELDDDLEALDELAVLEAEQPAREDHVGRRRDREELGDPLDDADDDGVQERHAAVAGGRGATAHRGASDERAM